MSERPNGTDEYEELQVPIPRTAPMFVREYTGTYTHVVWQPGNGTHYELSMTVIPNHHLHLAAPPEKELLLCVVFPEMRAWGFAAGSMPSANYVCEKYQVQESQDVYVYLAMLYVALETAEPRWPTSGDLGV